MAASGSAAPLVKTPTRQRAEPQPVAFETSVFINCPFDEDYEPILQAMLFCIIYLGLHPRLATERLDSGEVRLDKLRELDIPSEHSLFDQVVLHPRHF